MNNTIQGWFNPLSEWFNQHKSILVVIGMPIGALFAYSANNVVLAQDFEIHVKNQDDRYETVTKAVTILNYDLQLTKIRAEIDHLLDGVSENELSGRDKRKLERLKRDEERLENLLAE